MPDELFGAIFFPLVVFLMFKTIPAASVEIAATQFSTKASKDVLWTKKL